ncbi:peptide ABC transporter [Falsiroseomonas bella]|uniref:Peptide ABC transporter n=1 Tax=Falsiroseomonas bella TaxID=2184016 RepID=A0A317FH90_9PROT|nr:ABC transporter permease [Falsiroseomonas bella]PWS38165.1 peptide ABC transporter [Falsiroseomonas bella]
MLRYAAGRLVSALPVLLIVSLLSFGIVWIVPGDVAVEMAGPTATAEELARLRERLGLTKPWHEQLIGWYGALLQGDLGESILLRQGVGAAIVERLPVTLSLTFTALLIAFVCGTALGVLAAVRAGKAADRAAMGTALIGFSLPDFWLGLVFVYLFAVVLGWLPTGGYVPFTQDPLGWAQAMILPAGTLALSQMGLFARMTRAAMLEVLRQDYVRTARAKGMPGWIVVGKHALRNALIPVVTVAGIACGVLLGGAVVIESVFSLPGVGRLIVGAIQRRDYPVIQGGLLLTATIFVLVNLAVDLLYAALDPRIRHGRR